MGKNVGFNIIGCCCCGMRRVFGRAREAETAHSLYGDSITCGSGVLREYKPADSKIHTAETQNALQSYAAYFASELGASFGVFGRGRNYFKIQKSRNRAVLGY